MYRVVLHVHSIDGCRLVSMALVVGGLHKRQDTAPTTAHVPTMSLQCKSHCICQQMSNRLSLYLTEVRTLVHCLHRLSVETLKYILHHNTNDPTRHNKRPKATHNMAFWECIETRQTRLAQSPKHLKVEDEPNVFVESVDFTDSV